MYCRRGSLAHSVALPFSGGREGLAQNSSTLPVSCSQTSTLLATTSSCPAGAGTSTGVTPLSWSATWSTRAPSRCRWLQRHVHHALACMPLVPMHCARISACRCPHGSSARLHAPDLACGTGGSLLRYSTQVALSWRARMLKGGNHQITGSLHWGCKRRCLRVRRWCATHGAWAYARCEAITTKRRWQRTGRGNRGRPLRCSLRCAAAQRGCCEPGFVRVCMQSATLILSLFA